MMESRFVEVQKHSGERLRRYLSEQKLLNRDVRPKAADATLQIPIIREPDAAELAEIERIAGCKLHVGVGEFEKVQRRPAIEDLLGFFWSKRCWSCSGANKTRDTWGVAHRVP